MALELNKLTKDVNALGESVAQRLADLAERLPPARAALNRMGPADEALMRKVQTALSLRWAGAIPTAEPPSVTFPLPLAPERYNVIAADGSQIYPDRHGVALYFLVNVGSIVFRAGLAQAPSIASRPEVYYTDEDLFDETGAQTNKIKIDSLRDRRELGELARLAAVEAAHAPTAALLDNGLMLYFSLQSDDRALIQRVMSEYLDELDRLRATGAAVAGVVDRPRAASVVRLLHLDSLPPDEVREEALRRLGPFEYLTDALLFDDCLPPGHRSALFGNASPNNQIYYTPRGHAIGFFYLNAGRPGKPALLRVEVPKWVADDPERLDLVHAAIVEQSRVSDGFPYVLMRAHELAVVTVSERSAFEEMVMGAMFRKGLTPSISQKAQGKRWTGRK